MNEVRYAIECLPYHEGVHLFCPAYRQGAYNPESPMYTNSILDAVLYDDREEAEQDCLTIRNHGYQEAKIVTVTISLH